MKLDNISPVVHFVESLGSGGPLVVALCLLGRCVSYGCLSTCLGLSCLECGLRGGPLNHLRVDSPLSKVSSEIG